MLSHNHACVDTEAKYTNRLICGTVIEHVMSVHYISIKTNSTRSLITISCGSSAERSDCFLCRITERRNQPHTALIPTSGEKKTDSKPFYPAHQLFQELGNSFRNLKLVLILVPTTKNCPATKVLVFSGLHNTGVWTTELRCTSFARILHSRHF